MLKNSKIKNFYANRSRGFTLVEALVAITILIIGVIGPLQIAARGIGDGIFAANQIAANYLAQEAMELVVNKRYELARKYQYTELPSGETFFTQDADFRDCLIGGSGLVCSINATDGDMKVSVEQNPQTCSNCDLRFNKTLGLYVNPNEAGIDHAQDIGTKFTRKVILESADPNVSMTVKVVVSWKNKDVDKTLTLVEYLFSKG